MTPQVVVLGDANADMVIRLPDQIGIRDVRESEPRLFGGGSAANVAVGLARLGQTVAFIGSVGDDGYGRWVRDDLSREGVDTRGLVEARDAFTPMVIALIQPDGERLALVWPPERGADLRLRPEDVDAAWPTRVAWLHTTGMCLRASPIREAVLHGMALARGAGATVSLDLNLRLELWGLDRETRATLERAVGLSDVVLGSGSEEIAPLAEVENVAAAAGALSDGARTVVARLGADGALAVAPQGVCRAPAFPPGPSGQAAPVVDTLGAGDAFDAGFIAARLAGHDGAEALRWGNAVAALKIGRPGARGTPTQDELAALLG